MVDYSEQVNTQITFTDNSTGNPTSFGWDFGDGTPIVTTVQRETVHTYTTIGIFTITHTATNTCGTSGNISTIEIRAAPANIVVTAITPSVTTCAEPCNPTVNITWTNTGGVASTFTPAIVVDGISTPLATPETINPAQFITKTFIVTNLMKGSHTICANPDTGTTCVTITVEQVTQAGFGGAGMVMVAGLAVGALYMATKKPKI